MAAIEPRRGLALALEKAAKTAGARNLSNNAVRTLCFLCAAISIIVTVGIVGILLSESLPFFKVANLGEFLTGTKWQPARPDGALYGILPLLTGTLLITIGSGLVSIPLGLFVGIYLAEYAHLRVRKVLKPVLELLAGVPSVVFGFFALNLVTPVLQDVTEWFKVNIPAIGNVLPEWQGSNAGAAAIVVGFMTLPLVASLCEDAISSVPRALKEGAYGLGCTKAEVIGKIIVPSALSGIVASFILALSRAIGETMAVTIAAGATPQMTLNPGDEVLTMTAEIVNVSKGDLSRGEIQYQSIFAIGLLLFVFTLAMNIFAQRLVRKMGRGDR